MRFLLDRLLGLSEAPPGRVVDWRVVLPGAHWGWMLVGIAVVASAAVLTYRRHAHLLGGRWQAALLTIRLTVGLTLLGLFLQPTLRLTRVVPVKGTCVIVVDRTRSMELRDHLSAAESVEALRAMGVLPPNTPDDVPLNGHQRRLLRQMTRFDLLKRALATQADRFLLPLTRRFRVALVTLGSKVEFSQPLGLEEGKGDETPLLERIKRLPTPDGDHTRLGGWLRAILQRYHSRSLAAIVLFTDGANNAGEDPKVVAAYAGRLGVPIFPVGLGAAQPRDLRVAAILGEDVLFKDDLKPLIVRLETVGCVGRKFDVLLLDTTGPGERLLAARRNLPITREGFTTVELEFVPRRVGKMRLTVRIPPLPDEPLTTNNSRTRTVRVIDRRLRLLYVEGQPRWLYRFLCPALERDRRVQPTFLLQEADPETTTHLTHPTTGGDTPPRFIRSFPTDRRSLFAYDVVLFGDVDPSRFREEQLRWVVEFVERGGGFGLLAGPTYGPGVLSATPLGPILPVRLDGGERRSRFTRPGGTRRLFTRPYHPLPTPQGRSHPVIRLASTVEESTRLWAERPPLLWYCPEVTGLKPAARVLLEHPTVRTRSGPLPLVVIQPYGRGRTIYVGFDGLWRWRALPGRDTFYRFYGQMVQFLGLSRVLGGTRRVQVSLDHREVALGEAVTIFARVLDENYRPLSADEVTGVILRKGGVSSEEGREVAWLRLTAEPGAPGSFRGRFIPNEEGRYEVAVLTPDAGARKPVPTGATFTVAQPRVEFERAGRNLSLLRALAELSGGEVVPLDRLGKLPEKIRRRQRLETLRLDLPLWNSPLALLTILGLLSLEWFLRRRRRLA